MGYLLNLLLYPKRNMLAMRHFQLSSKFSNVSSFSLRNLHKTCSVRYFNTKPPAASSELRMLLAFSRATIWSGPLYFMTSQPTHSLNVTSLRNDDSKRPYIYIYIQTWDVNIGANNFLYLNLSRGNVKQGRLTIVMISRKNAVVFNSRTNYWTTTALMRV